MTPSLDIASTGYCLSDPGREYVVYQPGTGMFTVDLQNAAGDFAVEWLDVQASAICASEQVKGGALREFTPPTAAPSVLYLKAASL
jgi:hypothetical protein